MKGIVSLGVPRFESQTTGPQTTNLPLVELSNDQANENSKLLAWDLGGINSKWVFPKIVVPQNGWFTMENPMKMDHLGGFPPIFGNTQIFWKKSSNKKNKSLQSLKAPHVCECVC